MPKLLPVGGFGFVKASNIAKTFFEVAGIVDATQRLAIEQLIYNLCNFGLWDKIIALYPMVGGTTLAHSFNLKNLVKHNLTFFGGWTHSETGAKPNGINAYADTNLKANDVAFILDGSIALKHFSYYAGTTATPLTSVFLGCFDVANEFLTPSSSSGTSGGMVGGQLSPGFLNNLTGAHLISQPSVETPFFAKNKEQIKNPVSASGAISPSTINYFLGAYNFQNLGTNLQSTTAECRFSSFGLAMSVNDAEIYFKILDDFQAALNRLP